MTYEIMANQSTTVEKTIQQNFMNDLQQSLNYRKHNYISPKSVRVIKNLATMCLIAVSVIHNSIHTLNLRSWISVVTQIYKCCHHHIQLRMVCLSAHCW